MSSSMDEIGKIPWTLLFSHPLFSCFVSLYSLFLLYFPPDSLRILISPVPLLAGAFLISLPCLGSTRESNARPGSNDGSMGPELETGLDSNPDFMGDFAEWNLKLGAPLEVIHEEEESLMTSVKDPTRFMRIERFPSLSTLNFNPEPDLDSDSDSELNRDIPVMSEKDLTRFVRIERFPSLSIKPGFDLDSGTELDNDFPVMSDKDSTRLGRIERSPSLSIFKPEFDLVTDSEVDSDYSVMGDWILQEKLSLRWEEEEEEGEGLIEIKLDEYFNGCYNKMINQIGLDLDFFAEEEEGLIEIDISS